MLLRTTLLTLSLFYTISAFAQVGPSIGIGNLPSNNTPICEIPLYLGDYNSSGYQVGETAPDFNLFDRAGNEFVLSEALAEGKPVLIVGGNLTCPVFRNRLPELNQVINLYGDEITVIVVYGVEAHPVNDISPYFGVENVTNANYLSGILFEQPETYGQRKALVTELLNNFDIDAPVYLDGPCNEWWLNYGPAPNNAYLIDTDGTILIKQGWFDKPPNDILCEIYDVLGLGNPCNLNLTGSFSFAMTSDSITTGPAGTTLSVYGLLENNSDNAVEIEIIRMNEDMPEGWTTSLCTDVCYPAEVTYATAILEPQETLIYTNYFYTNDSPGQQGAVRIGFRNSNDFSNTYRQWMIANTDGATTSVSDTPAVDNAGIYPNPSNAAAWVQLQPEWGTVTIEVRDELGRVIHQGQSNDDAYGLPGDQIQPGMYFITIRSGNTLVAKGKWLVF